MTVKKKILIVEDEPDVSRYLQALFEDNGYDTLTALDGVEGYRLAKSGKPDLISLDIVMPNQSGVRTYRQYNKDPDLKHIPVIIISALGDDIKRFLNKLGGFEKPAGFMGKPIHEEKLIEMVVDILG
jgi:CheY-like chemotaxis protein